MCHVNSEPKRVRRSDPFERQLAEDGLRMLSVRLVEPGVTLYQNGTESSYLLW